MCRWLGYSGDAIAPAELVFHTRHSLIDQSLSARKSTFTTNGDGFGVGWHDHLAEPGIYKNIQPAWNDANLRDVCEHVRSPLFLAHVRAATGTDIQRSNCHPFRHDRFLFVHNGVIDHYPALRRELAFQVDPDLYPHIEGTTDTELMFFLALSMGLTEDVEAAVGRMVEVIEASCRRLGQAGGVNMTLGITDGQRLHAFRYASTGSQPSLFHSADIGALKDLAPADQYGRLERFPDNARAIVSEPLGNLPEAWEPVPESSYLIIEGGEVQIRGFLRT